METVKGVNKKVQKRKKPLDIYDKIEKANRDMEKVNPGLKLPKLIR